MKHDVLDGTLPLRFYTAHQEYGHIFMKPRDAQSSAAKSGVTIMAAAVDSQVTKRGAKTAVLLVLRGMPTELGRVFGTMNQTNRPAITARLASSRTEQWSGSKTSVIVRIADFAIPAHKQVVALFGIKEIALPRLILREPTFDTRPFTERQQKGPLDATPFYVFGNQDEESPAPETVMAALTALRIPYLPDPAIIQSLWSWLHTGSIIAPIQGYGIKAWRVQANSTRALEFLRGRVPHIYDDYITAQ